MRGTVEPNVSKQTKWFNLHWCFREWKCPRIVNCLLYVVLCSILYY